MDKNTQIYLGALPFIYSLSIEWQEFDERYFDDDVNARAKPLHCALRVIKIVRYRRDFSQPKNINSNAITIIDWPEHNGGTIMSKMHFNNPQFVDASLLSYAVQYKVTPFLHAY